MKYVGAAAEIAFIVTVFGGCLATFGMIWEIARRRPDPWMRGKYVSQPLVRRWGIGRTMALRTLIVLAALGWQWGSARTTVPSRAMFALLSLWAIDDYLTGREGPRKKRLRKWAKSKLKKIKPIRLRPAERWRPAPVPA